MGGILIVDDMAIFRDPIAACLREAGYSATCASNANDALKAMRANRPKLVLLDIAMPQVDGIGVLRAMRQDQTIAGVPVILLTAHAEREYILAAAQLGAKDYLLKSKFTLQDLLTRVKRVIGEEKPATANAPAAATPAPSAKPLEIVNGKLPVLLTAEQVHQRASSAMAGKALSGVVAEVIQVAASPRGDMSTLAQLIGRDPILSSKVLRMANSAAYTSTRGPVTNIAEAIKNLGSSTVRNIAATVGVFEAMPCLEPGSFDPIRCWQHSFAVAMLAERLIPADRKQEQAAVAYMAGLCHDLGEILFQTCLARECKQVAQAALQTKKPIAECEYLMLGARSNDLILTILQSLGLPDAIRAPIVAMHDKAPAPTPVTRVLRLAEAYANGMLLASSPTSALSPITWADCKAAIADGNPQPPDRDILRSEIFSMTALLSRTDNARLTEPLFPRGNAKIWLARDKGLSKFDPVEAALDSLASVKTHDTLPSAADAAKFSGVVIVGRSSAAAETEVRALARGDGKKPTPIFWMVEKDDRKSPAHPSTGDLTASVWPVELDRLAQFAAGL